MNIFDFIKNHKEFDELPFLIVFRTIQILQSKGLLDIGGKADVVDSI